MSDLEVVLKGFTGWLKQKNATMGYLLDESGTNLMLQLAGDEDFVVGVGVWENSLFVVAANPEVDGLKYRGDIGAKFADPETLGIEIVKNLFSYAQDANRNGNTAFEKGLIETAAELSLNVGSDLYSGLALMHLGVHAKNVDRSYYFAFLLTSAAVETLSRADNDEMLAMAISAREQCWEAFLPEIQKLTNLQGPLKKEFLEKAPESDMNELVDLSSTYIRSYIPTLTAEVSTLEDSDIVLLQLGSEGSDLITGGMDNFIWELMVLDYSEDGPYCRIPKVTISDSRNPDEVAFGFLVGLVIEGLNNLPSADGRDFETRTRIADIQGLSIQPLISSMVLLELIQSTMGLILLNLLEGLDFGNGVPDWLDSDALSEAINSYAEIFPRSFFVEEIFDMAYAVDFDIAPRGR